VATVGTSRGALTDGTPRVAQRAKPLMRSKTGARSVNLGRQLALHRKGAERRLTPCSQTIVFAHFLRGHCRVRISAGPHVAQLVCETKGA
jgi:hypothetical protein